MKWLFIIPAGAAGFLIGMVFFGMLPGIIFTEIWYGAESFKHPEVIGYLMRPAGIVGSLIAMSAVALFNLTD